MLNEYLWIFVIGTFGAFGFGWGTGANDLGNAFGTSVGAKTLTMKQAVIIASIFEFTGALLLGRVSTDTIAGGIADIESFTGNPVVYAYGMMCTLLVGTVWLAITTKYGWNVSSTHSIIGGIIGFALVNSGKDGVLWLKEDTSGKSFPPYKGIVPIVLSWFISPILTGLSSSAIFTTMRKLILRKENSHQLSYYVLPIFVLVTTWINVFFVLTKGAKKTLQIDEEWTVEKSVWITSVSAVGSSILAGTIGIPLLKKYIEKKESLDIENVTKTVTVEEIPTKIEEISLAQKTKNLLMNGVEQNIHGIIETDAIVSNIHSNAEVFDPKTENVFKYLQVFSAACVVFAHGAGEVGYMAGPLTSIWTILQTGTMPYSVTAPIWIIIISASGLVTGLVTYGHKITQAVGVKMSKITPTRGFAAELSTAFVIMIASQFGLPTSSSQCITGGIIGVGLAEGLGGVHWKFVLTTMASWINTMFFIGLGVGGLFAQGIYAPHKNDMTI